jgi:protocatechuate 3,4-dioxygenase beta subunit
MVFRLCKFFLVFLLLISSSCSGTPVYIKVTVLDDSGVPVEDATVKYFYAGSSSGR